MQISTNILIVEDEDKIRNFISYTLEKEGFIPHTATNAEDAMNILIYQNMDLVLLDLGLPDMDGSEIIKKLREWSDIPIIVVSARDQDNEKVKILDMGGDDYLTKPFSTSELMVRIRVALRRQFKNAYKEKKTKYELGELSLDISSRITVLKGEEIHLTPLEFDLLSLLFKHQGKVLTTKFIINEIYGGYYGSDTQALRTLMYSLRRKIEDIPAKPRYILTEVGVGYRLVSE